MQQRLEATHQEDAATASTYGCPPGQVLTVALDRCHCRKRSGHLDHKPAAQQSTKTPIQLLELFKDVKVTLVHKMFTLLYKKDIETTPMVVLQPLGNMFTVLPGTSTLPGGGGITSKRGC